MGLTVCLISDRNSVICVYKVSNENIIINHNYGIGTYTYSDAAKAVALLTVTSGQQQMAGRMLTSQHDRLEDHVST